MQTNSSDLSEDFKKYYDLETYIFGEVSTRFQREHALPAFDFFCIVIWKANRAKSKVAKRMLSYGHPDLETAVDALLAQVSDARDAKGRLAVLISLWGFRLPMASAILTVLYPNDFTIYDVRVCEALGAFGNVGNKSSFDAMWAGYAAFVERVRSEVPDESSLRDKDRYLWGMSFANQLRRDVAARFGGLGSNVEGS